MVQVARTEEIAPEPRKPVLLRLDPRLYNALARWAADDFRSTNAQIEYLLHRDLIEAGRIRAQRARPAKRRASGG